jgi:hypothetical protein
MKPPEYSQMTLEALRALALDRGLGDATRLGREELIALLERAPASAPSRADEPEGPQGIIRRAKRLVRRAVERTAASASDATPGPTPSDAAAAPAPSRPTGTRTDEPAHPDPRAALETETMAKLYEEQGHLDQAMAIYRKLLAASPEREEIKEKIAHLQARIAALTTAEHADVPPPMEAPRLPGPTEPMGMLDYEELPDAYGIDDVFLMAQDPWTLFVYWEVTADGRANAHSQIGAEGHASRLILRLYVVSSTAEGVVDESLDVDLSWDHGRRYLPAPRPGARVTVAVGLRAPSGAFAPIAHSRTVLVPPSEPAPEGPVEWMEVVTPKRRGLELEPIAVVTRGKERVVRGAPPRWDAGSWHHPGSSVPLPSPPSRTNGQPDAGGASSSWLRRPGSSEHRPRGQG